MNLPPFPKGGRGGLLLFLLPETCPYGIRLAAVSSNTRRTDWDSARAP